MTTSTEVPESAEDLLHHRTNTPAQRLHNLLHAQPALSPAIVLVLA